MDDGTCATAYSNGTPNGICTLRAAVEEANGVSGGGAVIDFAGVPTPATYTLTYGALTINKSVTIVGAGRKNTIIDGNGHATHDRVITVSSGTDAISNLTITDGHMDDALNGWGGGMVVYSDVTLTNVVVRDNSTSGGNSYGGGLSNNGIGLLTIKHSIIENNEVGPGSGAPHKTPDGGGIFGHVTIINSTIRNNTSIGNGGGVDSSNATITGSTIAGNTATTGGGMYQFNGTVTITNTTISGNHATGAGGGYYEANATATFYNATIAGNQANSDSTGSELGGGIANNTGTVGLHNTILFGNTYVYLRNNQPILDSNDCAGAIASSVRNIIGTATLCTISGTYSSNDPVLGSLGTNGGPTTTRALGAGSAAIDLGQNGGCTDGVGAAIATDQRGVRRPIDGDGSHTAECDIGAFEAGAFPRVEERDVGVTFDGWRGVSDPTASSGHFRVSSVKDETVAFTFTGNAVTWNTRKGPMMGKAQVLIDGTSKGTFDLRSLNTKPIGLTFSPLTAGRHTIVVKVLHQSSGPGFDVEVDSFGVGATNTDDGNCAVTYDSWRCTTDPAASGHSRRSSATAGSTASISFTGSSIQWLTDVGAGYGNAKVCIGSSCSTVNLSTGARTRTYSGLGRGTHTLKVAVLGSHDSHSTGNTIAVDAFSGPIAVQGP